MLEKRVAALEGGVAALALDRPAADAHTARMPTQLPASCRGTRTCSALSIRRTIPAASIGAAAGRAFIDRLRLFYHVANIGDARSLAIHPASTMHSQLSVDEQPSPGYVRLSIGIEPIDDILADLDQALSSPPSTSS